MFLTYQYHPAFDVYNCMFRFLQLLNHENVNEINKNKLRILDFYLLFPGLIENIKIKSEHRKFKRQFVSIDNRYNTSSVASQARQVFERIKPFQNLALCQLAKKKHITIDTNEIIELNATKLSREIINLFEQSNINKDLVNFLCCELYEYELNGLNGLKDRTGLMEFKYDAV